MLVQQLHCCGFHGCYSCPCHGSRGSLLSAEFSALCAFACETFCVFISETTVFPSWLVWGSLPSFLVNLV